MSKLIIKNYNGYEIYLSDSYYFDLATSIIDESYNKIDILKDDRRSLVEKIDFNGETLILKSPRSKDRDIWQRVISPIRKSEGRRQFNRLKKTLSLGFNGSVPKLYIQKKDGIFYTRSFVVSTFIDGVEGSLAYIDTISDTLHNIHSKGYLHGDSQLANFMIGLDNNVYLIDCKLSRNIYGGFGGSYEFIYLEESCYTTLSTFDHTDIYYKGALLLNRYLHLVGRSKKRVKNMFKRGRKK